MRFYAFLQEMFPCSKRHVESTVCQIRVLEFCPGGEDPLRRDRGCGALFI